MNYWIISVVFVANMLAETIKIIVGFKGKIEFDSSKPDGTPRKLLSVEKLKGLGWKPMIALEQGLTNTLLVSALSYFGDVNGNIL